MYTTAIEPGPASSGQSRSMLRLDHGGLEPRPLPVLGLADDVHVFLGLVADLVNLDAGRLLLEDLGQLVELGLVLRGYTALERYEELRARVVALRGDGLTADQIAEALNREGYAVPRGERYTG